MHVGVHVQSMYTKAYKRTHKKNMHANFEILLIFKILIRYFTEMFYYYFIKTCFVFRQQFCGVIEGIFVHFSTMSVFKCCSKIYRLKFMFSMACKLDVFINTTITYTDCINTYTHTILACAKQQSARCASCKHAFAYMKKLACKFSIFQVTNLV